MKISVVTISFNQGQYLDGCIRSILEQDYPDVEYIVVDAGSTDGSREIIREYQHQISSVIFEPDTGPPDGLNKGFSRATGDVLCYINADDKLLPGALRLISGAFDSQPELDVVLGHGFVIDNEGKKRYPIYSGLWSAYGYAIEVARAVQQVTFFRRTVFEKVGGFNTSNMTCWDGELLVDMTVSGAECRILDEFLGAFRIYDQSISGSGELSAAYRADRERIRYKILNRNLTLRDRIFGLTLRALYHLRHPQRTIEKIAREFRREPKSVLG